MINDTKYYVAKVKAISYYTSTTNDFRLHRKLQTLLDLNCVRCLSVRNH